MKGLQVFCQTLVPFASSETRWSLGASAPWSYLSVCKYLHLHGQNNLKSKPIVNRCRQYERICYPYNINKAKGRLSHLNTCQRCSYVGCIFPVCAVSMMRCWTRNQWTQEALCGEVGERQVEFQAGADLGRSQL